jgi:hypothetical protein
MLISWDPTWELLDLGSSPVSMPKSKLKALQESECSEKRVLTVSRRDESSSSEESSSNLFLDPPVVDFDCTMKIDSSDERGYDDINDHDEESIEFELGHHFDPKLFPAGVSPMVLALLDFNIDWEESVEIDDFVLGFHFDQEKFPGESSAEIEIIFYESLEDDEGEDDDDDIVEDTVEINFSPCLSCTDETESDTSSQDLSTCSSSVSSPFWLRRQVADMSYKATVAVGLGRFDDESDGSSVGVVSLTPSTPSNPVEKLVALCSTTAVQ